MKQSTFLVLMLGFGFLAPFTCSKSKHSSNRKEAQEQPVSKPAQSSKLVLYGPLVKVVAATTARG